MRSAQWLNGWSKLVRWSDRFDGWVDGEPLAAPAATAVVLVASLTLWAAIIVLFIAVGAA